MVEREAHPPILPLAGQVGLRPSRMTSNALVAVAATVIIAATVIATPCVTAFPSLIALGRVRRRPWAGASAAPNLARLLASLHDDERNDQQFSRHQKTSPASSQGDGHSQTPDNLRGADLPETFGTTIEDRHESDGSSSSPLDGILNNMKFPDLGPVHLDELIQSGTERVTGVHKSFVDSIHLNRLAFGSSGQRHDGRLMDDIERSSLEHQRPPAEIFEITNQEMPPQDKSEAIERAQTNADVIGAQRSPAATASRAVDDSTFAPATGDVDQRAGVTRWPQLRRRRRKRRRQACGFSERVGAETTRPVLETSDRQNPQAHQNTRNELAVDNCGTTASVWLESVADETTSEAMVEAVAEIQLESLDLKDQREATERRREDDEAWKAALYSTTPSTPHAATSQITALPEAVAAVVAANPDFGLRRIVRALQREHPALNVHRREVEVRRLVRSMTKITHPSVSIPASSTAPRSAEGRVSPRTTARGSNAAGGGTTSGDDETQGTAVSILSVADTPEWHRLTQHVKHIRRLHLRALLADPKRCAVLTAESDGVMLDYSRQQVTVGTMKLLLELARRQKLPEKMAAMARGEDVNFTEKRPVLHSATRARKDEEGSIIVDGVDVVSLVHDQQERIHKFSDDVRNGILRGHTGRRIKNVISVGIGGSYLGPAFVSEVLATEIQGIYSSQGFTLRFLSNVDPVDVERCVDGLDAEETLVVVVSKTFTTAETMLNARTMRQWLWDRMSSGEACTEVTARHMVACASDSSTDRVEKFGVQPAYFFKFWDWVGGRYSVCSSAGLVPLSLKYGFPLMEQLLDGANSMDRHFFSAPLHKNLPVLMGLLGVWNLSFLGYKSRTMLPYSEALCKFPAHVQQVDMESNGKGVTRAGRSIDYEVGEVNFGESGTNSQHSFFQLLHMGQPVPCDFLGFVEAQNHLVHTEGEELSSHDELMANFFAQPDALALGRTAEQLLAVDPGIDTEVLPHRIFPGNRPSLSLLFPQLTAYHTGQMLALYEHRTAVQGFIWDINSWDQWGVELGKTLASSIRTALKGARFSREPVANLNPSTTTLMQRYLQGEGGYTEEARQKWKQAPEGLFHKTKRRLWDDKFGGGGNSGGSGGGRGSDGGKGTSGAGEEEDMLAAVASSSSEGDSLSGPTKDYLKRLELQAAKVISATEGTAPSGGVLLEGQLRFWDVREQREDGSSGSGT